MSTKDIEAEYEARLRRVITAASNKEPDRVPIKPQMTAFAIDYYGHSIAEVTYNAQIGVDTALRYLEEFQPDSSEGFYSNAGKGPILELIRPKSCVWPGAPDKRIAEDSYHQFIEFPVLENEDMDFFERDYTGWLFRMGLPKVSGLLEPFADWNTASLDVNYDLSKLATQVARPEMRSLIETLWKIDDLNKDIRKIQAAGSAKMKEMGFPSFSFMNLRNGVPFDVYSDYFRGTLDSMADMYENRGLIERFIDERMEQTIADLRTALKVDVQAKANKWGRITLHKGMDGFMNEEQYTNLYWKHLRMLIHEMTSAGLMCYVYTEGPYTSRLDHLTEVDKNMVVYHFEDVDLALAKKKLGDIACIAGGFRTSIVEHGTKQQVIDEVRRILDICAPGGGYIFEGGAGIGKAPIENVHAMFETLYEYGKY